MDEYTPTTNQVKNYYAGTCIQGRVANYEEADAEFDRWLAKVIAEAEERGHGAGYNQGYRDAMEPGVVYNA